MIFFVSFPLGLYEVRVVRADGEDQVQDSQPVLAGIDLIIIQEGMELVREGGFANNRKRRMNSIEVALIKRIGGVSGWNLEGVDLIRDDYCKIIAMIS